MRKIITANVFLFILCSLLTCGSTKSIVGTYHTNFASLGFFGTTVRLRSDSTLEYVFQGDLIYDSTTGHYTVRGRNVYIRFDKEAPDTAKMYYRFNNTPLKTAFVEGDSIPYQSFLYIGHNKLFFAHAETGKKVTRATRYNKRKKYVLFGSNYYKRRWYLKQLTKSLHTTPLASHNSHAY
jgi:hypothetical protein